MKLRLLVFVTSVLTVLAMGLTLAGSLPKVAAQSDTPMLTLTANGAIYAWPSTDTESLGHLPFRSSVPVSARTPDSQWWRIPYPNGPDGYGWLSAAVVMPNLAAANVPLVEVIFATPTPEPATPTPSAPACTYNSAFAADLTVPDGTLVPPAQPVDKVWRMRNTGACPWEDGTQLTFVGGFAMSGPTSVLVPPTAPGATADIGVTLFAPSAPGTYKGIWQLQNSAGQVFGAPVTVVVRVPSPVPPTPVPPVQPTSPPPPPAGPSINFWTDKDRVKEGQCTTIHWDVSNVQAVYLEYGGKTRGVAGQGSQGVCPSTDGKTYVLRVVRPDGGTETRTITINIESGGGGGSGKFNASSYKISRGECTTLNWSDPKAHRAYLNGERVGITGSQDVCPHTTTKYNLEFVYNDSGSNRQDHKLTIEVRQ